MRSKDLFCISVKRQIYPYYERDSNVTKMKYLRIKNVNNANIVFLVLHLVFKILMYSK